MRVLILHSARAGTGRFSKTDLIRAFERAGHDVRYRSTHARHWKRDFAKAAVVVAVGGDGTVARVAIALAKRGRRAPPLAVIPAGKANNIARALGVAVSPARVAAGLEHASTASLAIGLIRSRWGKKRFVESVGIGPLSRLLRTDVPTLRGALGCLRRAFQTEPPRPVRVRADSRDLSGVYVMVHVMNIDAVGPRLVHAPNADPGDRTLDLVLLRESGRGAFNQYLARLTAGKRARCPVRAIRARRIEIDPWVARDSGHIDDRIWPAEVRPRRGKVRVEIETTIRVLVPRA